MLTIDAKPTASSTPATTLMTLMYSAGHDGDQRHLDHQQGRECGQDRFVARQQCFGRHITGNRRSGQSGRTRGRGPPALADPEHGLEDRPCQCPADARRSVHPPIIARVGSRLVPAAKAGARQSPNGSAGPREKYAGSAGPRLSRQVGGSGQHVARWFVSG